MSETFRPSLKGPPVYLALRDLLVARGRFALVGSVIALVSLLAGLLSGLAKTLKRWLGAQSRPRTASELQTLLGSWTTIYNQQRPHRSLDRRTPAVVYGLLPKATPAGSDAGTHHRIRYDAICERSEKPVIGDHRKPTWGRCPGRRLVRLVGASVARVGGRDLEAVVLTQSP